jgi:transcriptional regulator GlxA family with amidase domain
MNFGFLLFNDVEELDFVGPWEIITMWSRHFDGPQRCLTVAQHPGEIRCAKGLRILADVGFDDCPPLDYLLVPGGNGRKREVDNPVLIDFIRKQAATAKAVASVCTGSFLLHKAGLLKGKSATTHWYSLNDFRALGDITVVEQRFIHDGNIWIAAGVSAGIDMALAMVAHEAGDETAGKVQLAAEYYPSQKRYGSAHLSPDAPAYLREDQT